MNGNLTQDKNKGVTNISYNHLNLPVTVTLSGVGQITYTYDALGRKLKKFTLEGSNPHNTIYASIGNYVDGTLDFIFTDEGRAVDDNGTWRYEYYYKDHLGNTRLGFSDYNGDEAVDATEITQQQNYYPFGLEHKGNTYGIPVQTDHKYLYNGKELQEEMGLDWLDYGARNYDAQLGRFHNVDPLANRYSTLSGYNYVANNPLILVDTDGQRIRPINAGAEKAFNKLLASYGTNIQLGKAFGIDQNERGTYYSTHRGKQVATTQKQFDKLLKGVKIKLNDEDRSKAYSTYKALIDSKEIQVEVIEAGNPASTTVEGSSGTQVVAEDNALNSNEGLSEFKNDIQGRGGTSQELLDEAVRPEGGAGTGKYKPDNVGDDYSTYDAPKGDRNIKKSILIDGTDKTDLENAKTLQKSFRVDYP